MAYECCFYTFVNDLSFYPYKGKYKHKRLQHKWLE